MRVAFLILIFLFNALVACDHYYNLKKAGVILENVALHIQNPLPHLNQPLYAAAQNALGIYSTEYEGACENCKHWSDQVHYVYIMVLQAYIKSMENHVRTL